MILKTQKLFHFQDHANNNTLHTTNNNNENKTCKMSSQCRTNKMVTIPVHLRREGRCRINFCYLNIIFYKFFFVCLLWMWGAKRVLRMNSACGFGVFLLGKLWARRSLDLPELLQLQWELSCFALNPVYMRLLQEYIREGFMRNFIEYVGCFNHCVTIRRDNIDIAWSVKTPLVNILKCWGIFFLSGLTFSSDEQFIDCYWHLIAKLNDSKLSQTKAKNTFACYFHLPDPSCPSLSLNLKTCTCREEMVKLAVNIAGFPVTLDNVSSFSESHLKERV